MPSFNCERAGLRLARQTTSHIKRFRIGSVHTRRRQGLRLRKTETITAMGETSDGAHRGGLRGDLATFVKRNAHDADASLLAGELGGGAARRLQPAYLCSQSGTHISIREHDFAMRVHAPLDDLVGGKTSVRVLRALCLFPGKQFTGRELARAAGGAPSKVIQELQRFRSLGLVTRRTFGRTQVWRLNADHALVGLLVPAFEGEHRLPGELVDELRQGVRDKRISSAVLFGSFARGDETPQSDVDLLVVTERTSDVEAVRAALDALSSQLSRRFGLRLSPIVVAEKEVPRLRKTRLFVSIAAEGRAIRGEPL